MQLSKKELKLLYHSKTNKEICSELGISNPTLISALKKAGIERKGKGNYSKKSKITLI